MQNHRVILILLIILAMMTINCNLFIPNPGPSGPQPLGQPGGPQPGGPQPGGPQPAGTQQNNPAPQQPTKQLPTSTVQPTPAPVIISTIFPLPPTFVQPTPAPVLIGTIFPLALNVDLAITNIFVEPYGSIYATFKNTGTSDWTSGTADFECWGTATSTNGSVEPFEINLDNELSTQGLEHPGDSVNHWVRLIMGSPTNEVSITCSFAIAAAGDSNPANDTFGPVTLQLPQ